MHRKWLVMADCSMYVKGSNDQDVFGRSIFLCFSTQSWMALNSAEVRLLLGECVQGGVSSAPQISAGRRAPSASANLDEPVMGEQHNHPLPEGHGSCQPSTEDVGFFITSVQRSCSRLVLTTLAFIVPQSVLNLTSHSFGESPYSVLMLLLHRFNS